MALLIALALIPKTVVTRPAEIVTAIATSIASEPTITPLAEPTAKAGKTTVAVPAAKMPWWIWWLSIPLLGAFWWVLKRRNSEVLTVSAVSGSADPSVTQKPEPTTAILTGAVPLDLNHANITRAIAAGTTDRVTKTTIGRAIYSSAYNQPDGQDRVEVQEDLIVERQRHSFQIDPASITQLQQETAVSKVLQSGTYTIRLKSSPSDCPVQFRYSGEPWVLLWLYGGKVINRETGIEVGGTWLSLNGYRDALFIEVREPITLSAFFLGTDLQDKTGQVTVTVAEKSQVEDLVVHTQRNCYYIEPESARKLKQETSASRILQPGTYIVRIKSDAFSYRSDFNRLGEPWILLWIYGGKIVNRKTNIEVNSTWTTLNGYADVLVLDVRETTTLSAFFLDTFLSDRGGGAVLSLIRI
jgi:hypothetical protein